MEQSSLLNFYGYLLFSAYLQWEVSYRLPFPLKKNELSDMKIPKKTILKQNKANFPDEIVYQKSSEEEYFSKHYTPPKVCVLFYFLWFVLK